MNTRPLILLLATCASAVGTASAQTFCSVREPNRVIHEMFPDSTGFRTDILEITADNAAKLPADLPFVFDRREVTRHPLHIVLRDGKVIGYVQARTQATRWGLTEFVWALDSRFNLLDFRVQRSREPGAVTLGSSRLGAGLRGLGLNEVRRRWGPAWIEELQKTGGLSADDRPLVEAAVAAGAKTIWLATEIWKLPAL